QAVELLSVATRKTVGSFSTDGLRYGFVAADRTSLNAAPIRSPLGLLFFSPDGKVLTATTMNGQLFSWVVKTGSVLPWSQSHSNEVLSYAFSPDGGRLATGSVDRTVKLWDWKSGDEVRTIKGHGNWVSAVDWSGNGNFLTTGDSDGLLKIW